MNPPENPASLVALQCAISPTLMRPDPLAGHHIATRRTRHEVPRLVGKRSSELANGKKVVNHLRSNKNIRKTMSKIMMEEGQEGCGGRTEERIPASGVVWKEAPESAIHSALTGSVSPMVLKDCARAAWSHP